MFALFGFVTPAKTTSVSVAPRDSSYLLVGGQNGTWFESGQVPRLEKVDLSNNSVTNLTPASGAGVVWTGGWNGSQWLIAGFGTASGPKGSNPYLYLYDGQTQVKGGSLDQYDTRRILGMGVTFSRRATTGENGYSQAWDPTYYPPTAPRK